MTSFGCCKLFDSLHSVACHARTSFKHATHIMCVLQDRSTVSCICFFRGMLHDVSCRWLRQNRLAWQELMNPLPVRIFWKERGPSRQMAHAMTLPWTNLRLRSPGTMPREKKFRCI